MILSIHKPGQGYWTRMLSAIGGGTIVVSGIVWLLPHFNGIESDQTRVIVQGSIAVGVVTIFGGLLWYFLNKPRIVDFMIATEAEMRKVNWPSRKQIIGSTLVVISGTILMVLYLLIVDLSSGWFFKQIGVLDF